MGERITKKSMSQSALNAEKSAETNMSTTKQKKKRTVKAWALMNTYKNGLTSISDIFLDRNALDSYAKTASGMLALLHFKLKIVPITITYEI